MGQPTKLNNFLEDTSCNKHRDVKLENFTLSEYTKFRLCCSNKRIKKTIQYVNSLISIEYIINSFSDLTFLKNTNLNENQLKALSVLPIKPSDIDYAGSYEHIQAVKKYLLEINNKNDKDKYDAFFSTNFKQA